MCQGDEFLDKTCRLQHSSAPTKHRIRYPTRRTLSPAPVAPSISSTMTRTGFELPIAAPDSRAGRILSSTTVPERASLTPRRRKFPTCFLGFDYGPRIDLENLVPCLLRNYMRQCCLSQARWSRNQQQLTKVTGEKQRGDIGQHSWITFSCGRRYSSKC